MADIRREQLEAEKKLFKRLVISYWDLEQARLFAQLILKQNPKPDKDMLRALNTALIIAYWRPFSDNEPATDTTAMLPTRYLNSFSPSEKTLHGHLRNLRNKAIAHSDSEAHRIHVCVHNYAGIKTCSPTGRNLLLLSTTKVERLLGMTEKLLEEVSNEWQRICNLLRLGEF